MVIGTLYYARYLWVRLLGKTRRIEYLREYYFSKQTAFEEINIDEFLFMRV